MTRGEGEHFTARVQAALHDLGMPAPAIAHHAFLADWMAHTRAFFKLEWHPDDATALPLAACYFRRRPDLETVLARLRMSAALASELRQIAITLDKTTVHFVAAAFRPDRPVHHKLYFSQYVTPATHAAVEARIDRLFDRLGGTPALRALWRDVHREMFRHPGDATCFVSVSFTDEHRLPWFKIDYPDVAPALAAAWAPPDERAAVIRDAEAACAAAGTTRLTFLGVRLGATDAHPHLKYYADLPPT